MIIIRGHARARAGARQALAEAVLAVSEATRSDDGCLVYEFSADLFDAEIIRNIEVWRDQKALDDHMAHDHTVAFLSTVRDLVDGEPIMEFIGSD